MTGQGGTPTVHEAIQQLTREEKVTLLCGAGFWHTPSIDRLGIASAILTDGPHGVRYQQEGGSDHLGLHDSLPATAFPTAAATGSTWDPELLHQEGQALAREARDQGVDVLLGPGVNIKRSPLGGRNFEYFSEDPLLAGELGAAWVSGLQSQGVGASVKHYAANNQETERMRISAEVDERTLREIYLPAFENVVTQAQPATVMSSYNKINGTYASENNWLLTEVLRDQWGYTGYVVSDWGAVQNPVAAVAAGLDLTMPAAPGHAEALLAALRDGELTEEIIDQAVSRVLNVHDRLRAGRQGEKLSAEQGDEQASDVSVAEHHELARRIATESSVLLINEAAEPRPSDPAGDAVPKATSWDVTAGLLPLDPQTGGEIAVIGEFARSPRFQGAGSSHIVPTQLDDALEAIQAATDRHVNYSAGFRLDGEEDQQLQREAVAAAQKADVVVLFLGLPDEAESEGFDREHLQLPDVQRELVAQVAEVNLRTVVVLSNGSAVDTRPLLGRVPAILEMWLGGQASGTAAADLIFGAAEPGGRLAETIPLCLEDTPAHINWPGTPHHVLYGERIYVGYRWYDTTARDVAFPFGHGLSYTSFSLSDADVTVPDSSTAHAIVKVTVTNIGPRAGSEVVQVYVGDDHAQVDRPVRELKAFQKVRLEPGESQRVCLELSERAFAYWGESGWTVEPGVFRVEIGTSSRAIAFTCEAHLDVPARVPTLTEESTLGDWMAHPIGAPMLGNLNTFISRGEGEIDESMVQMVSSMPLKTVMSMSGEDGEQNVRQMLHRVQEAQVNS